MCKDGRGRERARKSLQTNYKVTKQQTYNVCNTFISNRELFVKRFRAFLSWFFRRVVDSSQYKENHAVFQSMCVHCKCYLLKNCDRKHYLRYQICIVIELHRKVFSPRVFSAFLLTRFFNFFLFCWMRRTKIQMKSIGSTTAEIC